jgi:hypothetical protein
VFIGRALVLSLAACSGDSGRKADAVAGQGGVQDDADTAVALDCPGSLDRDGLTARDQLEVDLEALAAAPGQRAGDAANAAWVDGLEARFAALPGVTVDRHSVAVSLDLVSASSLVATWDGVSTDVPVQGALPVAAAVSAPSRYSAPGDDPPADMAGKVAVLELRFDSVPVVELRGRLLHEEDPRGTLADQAEYRDDADWTRPWMLGDVQAQVDAMVAAGAVGVVLLSDLEAELAAALHLAIGVDGVPLVVVADEPARRLRDAARVGTGFQADIAVEATVSRVDAAALRARIPGASPELVALHAPSDPGNTVEAGGALALLALAEGLSTWPVGCLERDLLIDLSPGWRTDMAGAAALAEHLGTADVAWIGGVSQAGAVEHLPDGAVAQGLVRTGLLEPRVIRVDSGWGLSQHVVDAVAAEALDRSWVLDQAGGQGLAAALAPTGAPVVERHSGPWTLPFAGVAADAVDPAAIRSDAAWLGALVIETGAVGAEELAAD